MRFDSATVFKTALCGPICSILAALALTSAALGEIIVPETKVNLVTQYARTTDTLRPLGDEGAANLFNGSTTDRCIMTPKPNVDNGIIPTAFLYFSDGVSIAPNAYCLWGSANQSTARSPKKWAVFGSNDQTNWTLLDARENQTDWSKGESRTFAFDNLVSYSSFKIEFYENNGDGSYTTVAEMELYQFEQTDALYITYSGYMKGSPTPAYGGLSGFKVGDTQEMTMPETSITDVDSGDVYLCTGFTLTDYAGNVLKEGTLADLPYTYTHHGCATFTWNWVSQYDQIAAATMSDLTEPAKSGVNEITASQEDNGTAAKNVFANSGSRWLVANPKTLTSPAWLQYRFLDAARIVTGFKMNIRSGDSATRLPVDFIFQGSNDGETYTDLISVEDAGTVNPSAEKRLYSFVNATPYSYYRLWMTKFNDSSWLEIGDLEFYSVYMPNSIRILGSPKSYGAPTPGYGFTTNLQAGTTMTFSAPQETVQISDTERTACSGYTLNVNGTDILSDSTPSFSYTHEEGDFALLYWNFDVEYLQTISATGSGLVEPPTHWASVGSTVTLTATVGPKGETFVGWVGDVDDVDKTAQTITYTVDGARTIQAVFAVPLCVSPDGDDENEGTSAEKPLKTLARAIERSPAGGEIKVLPGEYLTAGDSIVVDKELKIHSTGTREETVFVGTNEMAGALLTVNDPNAIVQGLTFRNGYATTNLAAGVVLFAGTVTNCVIESCVAESANGAAKGGGVYIVNTTGTAFLSDTVVSNCTAQGCGAGVYARGGSVKNCRLIGNTATKQGGGAFLTTDATEFSDNWIEGNTAKTAFSDNNPGGGVFVTEVTTLENLMVTNNVGCGVVFVEGATLRNSTLVGNQSVRGAGIWANQGTIDHCVIRGNTCSAYGGGAFLENVRMQNTLVIGNTCTSMTDRGGGGLFCRGGADVINCTITDNVSLYGSGIWVNDPFTLVNSIVAGNLLPSGEPATSDLFSGAIAMTNMYVSYASHDCWGTYLASTNNSAPYKTVPWEGSVRSDLIVGKDPRFNAGYTLKSNSPCVNAGVNTFSLDADNTIRYTEDDVDLADNPRIYRFGDKKHGIVDMGCYELQSDPAGMGFRLIVR